MRLFSMTVPMVAFEVSTSGDTPVTVAVSARVPNSSAKLTRTVCCTCNSTSRVAVLKPSSSLFTVYTPGGNAGKSNRPTSLLEVVRVALVALFTTVTVAPGTTAPAGIFDFSGDGAERLRETWRAEKQPRQSHQQSPAHRKGSFRARKLRRSISTL